MGRICTPVLPKRQAWQTNKRNRKNAADVSVADLNQFCDDILLPLAHWFSFSSCHKKSASCVIYILP